MSSLAARPGSWATSRATRHWETWSPFSRASARASSSAPPLSRRRSSTRWDAATAGPVGVATVSVTPREQQVWTLLERGRSNKEIAPELSIGVATAKNHVHNLLAKLRVSTRAEAAAVRHPTRRAVSARSTSLPAT